MVDEGTVANNEEAVDVAVTTAHAIPPRVAAITINKARMFGQLM